MSRLTEIRNTIIAVACCLAAASCSTDGDDGTALPDGKYPIAFTAAVDGLTVTRSAGKDTWTVGDKIAISTDGGTNSKTYQITDASTGAMTPANVDDAYYWKTNADRLNILAWHPATGATDVNISNQSGGLASFDYLTANETFSFSDNGGKLSFKHQMAKVTYTLEAGNADTYISQATVSIYGHTTASFDKGIVTGSDNGWITPHTDREVLVVPQDMTGQKFIRVTIGGREYFYTPKEGKANLKANMKYTYTITVTETGLVVSSNNSASWTEKDAPTGSTEENTYQITVPTGVTIAIKGGATGALSNNRDGVYTLTGGNEITITPDENIEIKGLYSKSDDGTYILKGDIKINTLP